jgi:hypothetical protein
MKSVKIGPMLYSVTEAPISEYGLIDYGKQIIVINSGLAPQAKQVTLWHEIVHGILYNLGHINHDEVMVDSLAHGIVSVLADNPQLKGTKA